MTVPVQEENVDCSKYDFNAYGSQEIRTMIKKTIWKNETVNQMELSCSSI